jgi:hypothetical protein
MKLYCKVVKIWLRKCDYAGRFTVYSNERPGGVIPLGKEASVSMVGQLVSANVIDRQCANVGGRSILIL